MIPNDDKISSIQLGVFVYLTMLGVGIFTLPSDLVKYAKNDAWILCIVSGLLNIIFIYCMCKVGERFSNYGLVGTLRVLFGKFLGTILAVPVFLYFLFFASVEIRLFAETTKLYLLRRTPIEFVILPLLLLAVLLSRRGIEPIVRFFEISTPIVLVVIAMMLIVMVPKSDYSRLMPVFKTPITDYFKGMGSSLFAYAGFEVLLIVFPYVRKPKKALKASIIALVFIVVLYTIIIVQCIVRLGVEETKNIIYPTVSLIRASEVPGFFIERIEGLLLAIWVMFVFTTVVSFIYGFSVVGADILKHREKNHIISLFIPITYLITLQGSNIKEVFNFSKEISTYLGYYTLMILPVIMFIASLLRRKVGKNNEC